MDICKTIQKLEKNVVIYFAIVCNLYDDVYHTPYK